MKTSWNTNKSETGIKVNKRSVHPLNIGGDLTNNWQTIANSFNDYSLRIADKIIDNNGNDKMVHSNNNNNPLNYMLQILKHPFPNTKFNYM